MNRLRNLAHRIGHRGATLILLSLLDVAIGSGLFTIKDLGPAVRQNYAGQEALMPLAFWAYLWFAAAAVLLISAFRKRDGAAFLVGTFIKVLWAIAFLESWFLGAPRAWISACTWFAIAAWLGIVSGWKENAAVRPMVVRTSPRVTYDD